jgi:hypothetical protein
MMGLNFGICSENKLVSKIGSVCIGFINTKKISEDILINKKIENFDREKLCFEKKIVIIDRIRIKIIFSVEVNGTDENARLMDKGIREMPINIRTLTVIPFDWSIEIFFIMLLFARININIPTIIDADEISSKVAPGFKTKPSINAVEGPTKRDNL